MTTGTPSHIFDHTTAKKSTPKAKKMKKTIRKIASVTAVPFTIIGLLVYLLVAYTEGEHDPYE